MNVLPSKTLTFTWLVSLGQSGCRDWLRASSVLAMMTCSWWPVQRSFFFFLVWIQICDITFLTSRPIYFPSLPERLGSAAVVVMHQTQTMNQLEKSSRLQRPERTLSRRVQDTSQQFVCLSHVGNMKGCSSPRRSFLQTYLTFIMRPRAAGHQAPIYTTSHPAALGESTRRLYSWQQICCISQTKCQFQRH